MICIGLCMPEQENEEETSAPKIGGQCKTHLNVIHQCKNKGQAKTMIQGKYYRFESLWLVCNQSLLSFRLMIVL